jgi:hypothetical protein
MSAERKASMQEKIAAAVASAIVLTAIVYWIVQINGVLEMFKLAAGG